MATFHLDRNALKFEPDTVHRLQQSFDLPANICEAHIAAMNIGTSMRERLRHAAEGLLLIQETTFEDNVKQQMLTSLRQSLEAIATELSILLYENMEKTPVAWDDARRIVTEIFNRELGPGFVTPNKVSGFESDADVIANDLLSSDAHGHYSHGVERIIRYLRVMRAGNLHANKACRMTEEFDHMGRFDGACTFGQVGMRWAMDRAMKIADEQGCYTIGGSNLGHIGRLQRSAQDAVLRNFLIFGFATTNGGRSAVEMNGTEALLGTNPMVIGVPNGREGIVFDMASSGPEGTMNVMLQQDLLAPFGFMRKRDGTSTIYPRDLYTQPTALLTPAGQHKGLGLGIIADASVAAMAGKSHHGTDERKTDPLGVNNVWLTLVKVPGIAHHQILDSYADMLANAEVFDGTTRRGLFPGLRGHRAEMEARAGNIHIPTEIWNHVLGVHKTGKLPEILT